MMYLDIMTKLVSIKSAYWYQGTKVEIIKYVQSLFDSSKWHIYDFESNGLPSTIIANKDVEDHNYDLLLYGHLDVVDVVSENQRTIVEDDTFYHWRWTLDMKWACAVTIAAVLQNKDKILNSNKSIALVFVNDEELWGKDWIEYLTSEINLGADTVLIPDTWEGMESVLKRWKGFLFWEVEFLGKAAHGCRPWRWINPIEQFVRFYKELMVLFPQSENDVDGWNSVSVNIWKIQWWTAINAVSDKLKISVDMRFPPEKSSQNIKNKLEKLIEGYDANLVYLHEFWWFDLPDSVAGVEVYRQAAADVLWKPVLDLDEYWSNDGRFFVWTSRSIIMTGPSWHGFHATDERVYKEELEKYSKILNVYLSNYIKE